jgi:hypothetical protein
VFNVVSSDFLLFPSTKKQRVGNIFILFIKCVLNDEIIVFLHRYEEIYDLEA